VANRLARETSPYLLQHAHNPVDWYPWGEEALSLARREDRPILLSIGYSACHWCHVMERESFEDPGIAAEMNEGFVNIKVDREERPDLDSIYMRAVQLLTGHGGWPLTAFLTPDGRAFFGGTYFPPEPRHGMPSFRQVLTAVSDAYRNRRGEVERGSEHLLGVLKGPDPGGAAAPGVEGLDARGGGILEHAVRFLAGRFDPTHGGFGPAPKFPQPMTLEVLLRQFHRTGDGEALDMAVRTLQSMARGGIRDHVGGGFHRYSVDGRWLVPHFEKMLYDNGLLARVYLHAFQITRDPELLEAATSTLDYILEDLRGPEGGFYSSRDADSEGEEGLFYLWRPGEVDEVLGKEEGELFRRAYDVSGVGNFEGRNILHLPRSLESIAATEAVPLEELVGSLRRSRKALNEARSRREPPFRDEKVLASWNSFVLRALAEAGAALGRDDYLQAAVANASFLLDSLREGGRLRRSWKDGSAKVPAFLEDYAGLGNALLTLHESTLEPRWLVDALDLAEQVIRLFWDEDEGIFYDSPHDGERLVIRPRDIMDSATPSGNSLAVELLMRAAAFTGSEGLREPALRTLAREAGSMRRFPSAFGRLLSASTLQVDPPVEVVLLGRPGEAGLGGMLRAAHEIYLPNRVVSGGDPAKLPPFPLFQGREPRDERVTAYVCRHFTCSAPLHDPRALREELEKEEHAGGGRVAGAEG
jgi:uncharacterized protein